jgi:hypothetical protein
MCMIRFFFFLFASLVTTVMQPEGNLAAQDHSHPVPVDSLLRQFEREIGDPTTDRNGSAVITRMLARPEQYSSARIDSVLTALELLAVSSDHARTRSVAAVTLSTAGDQSLPNPLPGVADRLIRIYRRSEDPLVRSTLIGLPLTRQADRSRVVNFLASIAVEPSLETRNHWGDNSARAVQNLALMGESGSRELRRLYQSGQVQSPEARRVLDVLARNDFRLPEDTIK